MAIAEAEQGARPFDQAAEIVRRLLARGQYPKALSEAKTLHKQHATPLSEALLVDAYLAKIESFPPGREREAEALIELVESRYPSARERLFELRPILAARSGRFETLLRPLAEKGTEPNTRRRIEAIVQREARDLQALAECSILTAEHPLSVAAAAAWKAFSAVTDGPMEDEALALPEISSRSPTLALETPDSCYRVFLSRRGSGLFEAPLRGRAGLGAGALGWPDS